MIGTTGAAVIFIGNVILTGMLGIAAGIFACFVFRQAWRVTDALVDAPLAAIVAIGTAYLFGVIETAKGTWGFGVWTIFCVAAGSVIIRHLLPGRRANSR
jgi:hypothetical protein